MLATLAGVLVCNRRRRGSAWSFRGSLLPAKHRHRREVGSPETGEAWLSNNTIDSSDANIGLTKRSSGKHAGYSSYGQHSELSSFEVLAQPAEQSSPF